MRAERALLRTGEYLVGRACRRLPSKTRDQRYREWTAELPAILHDPEVRLAPFRAVRMLGYAADTMRGTALRAGPARRRLAAIPTPILGLIFVASLALAAWTSWDTARSPGHWVNYVRVAWCLFLAAWPVSHYLRPTARLTVLICMIGSVAGLVANTWDAVHSPGDWVNYLAVALLSLSIVALWLVSPWAQARRQKARRPGRRPT
jgi:hypothetical protein